MVEVVVPKHTRLILVLLVPVLWAVLAFTFAHAEYAQRESNVKPIHSLIIAVLPLVIALPITIRRLTAMRFFRLYLAIWMGATIPALLLLFTRVAGFSGRCDYLFYGLGFFAMVVLAVDWLQMTIRQRQRQGAAQSSRKRPMGDGLARGNS